LSASAWPDPIDLFEVDGIVDMDWAGILSGYGGAGISIDLFDHYPGDDSFDDELSLDVALTSVDDCWVGRIRTVVLCVLFPPSFSLVSRIGSIQAHPCPEWHAWFVTRRESQVCDA
jgi:hypothetical protein